MAASQLQRDLKKKNAFASPEQEAVLNILRTSDQFQNRFGRLLREHGLTLSQYNVLRILRGEGKPLPCREIGARLIQVVPAMTGLIDRLEAQSLVRRDRCSEDRRVIYIELTDAARTLLQQLDELMNELEQQLMGHLTRKELTQLSRLLEKSRLSLTAED